MRRTIVAAFLLMVVSALLGATVLQQPFAQAAREFQQVIVANEPDNAVPTREQNVDADGNIEVSDASSRGAVRHYSRLVSSADRPARGILVPAVPEGKAFLISYVNISGASFNTSDDFQAATCALLVIVPGEEEPRLLGLPATASGGNHVAVSDGMSLLLHAGETLRFNPCRLTPSPGGNVQYDVHVVGHYVPAQG